MIDYYFYTCMYLVGNNCGFIFITIKIAFFYDYYLSIRKIREIDFVLDLYRIEFRVV